MDIQRLIHAFIRKSWIIIIFAILGASAAGYLSLLNRPVYQTETTLYIINRSSSVLSGNAINLQDLTLTRQLISDYGNIITTRKVLEPVLKEVKDDTLTVEAVSRAISVNLKKDSNVMSISVAWFEPEQAAAIANAVSRSFANEISKLTTNNSIGILDEAQVPEFPLPSSRGKLVFTGLMAGIIAALGLIYVRELFNNKIYSADDIENGLNLQVIGIIPEHNIH